jgi:catechol 2,3-dioxygenase-like lactoylglutathione lyase family enzyme
MEFGQVHHIEYYVRDLARSNQFWDWFMPFLGYKKYQEWSKGLSWKHKTGTYIVFVQVDADAASIENNRHGSGLNHIAFQGKDSAHLRLICDELKKRQIKILQLEERYVCVEDPNGFAIEIYAE